MKHKAPRTPRTPKPKVWKIPKYLQQPPTSIINFDTGECEAVNPNRLKGWWEKVDREDLTTEIKKRLPDELAKALESGLTDGNYELHFQGNRFDRHLKRVRKYTLTNGEWKARKYADAQAKKIRCSPFAF